LLIPIATIEEITKERTAKIIPNAVGVSTSTDKHVFASLISRDTTYKLMHKMWKFNKLEKERSDRMQREIVREFLQTF